MVSVIPDQVEIEEAREAGSVYVAQRGVAANEITYPCVGCGAWQDLSPDLSSQPPKRRAGQQD
jgi:hypothetical protein